MSLLCTVISLIMPRRLYRGYIAVNVCRRGSQFGLRAAKPGPGRGDACARRRVGLPCGARGLPDARIYPDLSNAARREHLVQRLEVKENRRLLRPEHRGKARPRGKSEADPLAGRLQAASADRQDAFRASGYRDVQDFRLSANLATAHIARLNLSSPAL